MHDPSAAATFPLPTLTVVMPALNEEANIVAAIEATLCAFDHYDITGEVIVINDGSRDRTPALVRGCMARDQRVRMHEHESPKGIGVSFWDGVRAASHEFVTMFPVTMKMIQKTRWSISTSHGM